VRLQIQSPHPEEPRSGVSKDGPTQAPLPPFETRSCGALLRVRGEIDALGVELVFDDAAAVESLLLSATQSKAGA
jgi:hypothetical protein